MIKKIFLFLLLISVPLIAQKQNFDRASYYSYGQKLFSEAHLLPYNDKDSTKIIIMFKTVYESLIFVQVNPLDNPGNFQAIPFIEIFFKDENGIIKNRVLWSDTVWAKDYDETKSKNKFSAGYVETTLPNTDYKCTVQLLDRYKKPSEKNDLTISTIKNNNKNTIYFDPILTYSEKELPQYKSIPFILSNKINFNSKDTKIIIPLIYPKKYNVYNYNLKKINLNEDNLWNDSVNIWGRVYPSDNSKIKVEKTNNMPVLLSIKTEKKGDDYNDEKQEGILTIDLPKTGLSPGKYNLLLKNENNLDSINYEFEVVWLDIPLSLRNPDYAIEMMYYILNDEEYKKMKDSDNDKKADLIMKYWKQKDPTKDTPYNEMMTEYFRRVDYAFFNYQTIQEKDGAKTERGKIYILFGKPDNIEKSIKDGVQTEIWNYKKISKKFYFELVSNGLYILTKID